MEPFSYSNSPGLVREAPAAAPADKPATVTTPPGSEPAGAKPDQNAPFKTFEETAEKPEPQQGGALGDGVSEALREYREQRRQETPFYDPTKDFTDAGLEQSADAAGLVGEERDAIINEQKRMLSDLQFTTNEAREVVLLVDQYAAAPPDVQTAGKWANEAWSALVRQHGQKEANSMLADAQRLVARDPRVKQILDVTGLGNHPKIVAKLVAFARSEKGKGRLK